MNWSEWKPVSSTAAHAGSAIYEVRLADEDGRPIPLARFLATDAAGILCIGMTTGMERRRNFLHRAISKGTGHSEGNLLNLLERYCRLKEAYPGAKYEYRFLPVRGDRVRDAECAAIKGYLRRFGETPPLNAAIPDRYCLDSWEEAGCGPSASQGSLYP